MNPLNFCTICISLILSVIVMHLTAMTTAAADYYVAENGDDGNAGTKSAPFRTIQKAADVMNSGDRCFIRSGVYRETVTITEHNLTFEAYNNEFVVVTGADRVTGWTQHSGEIYKAGLSGVEPQFTQVFYYGTRQHMARYPDNITGDMLSIDDNSGYAACTVAAAGAVTFDSPLPGGADHWVGGYFRAISGLTWANPMGTITASSGNSLTCDMISTVWEDSYSGTLGQGKGYVFHLNALDREGEWYHQNNTLYFWKPGGGAPGDSEVEAQMREFAFKTYGYDQLTLRGLNIKAASLDLINTDNSTIENCTVRYLKGFLTRSGYGTSQTQLGGVRISGNNNLVTGCHFYGSWGNLLNFESGQDNDVTNCIFENNGWISQFTTCVLNYSHNLDITNCFFGSTGRFHVRMNEKTNIFYSEFTDCMKMGQDAGSIQAVDTGLPGARNLGGAEFAYNILHDMDTLRSFNNDKEFVVGFYLEGAENYTVHHNLTYNITTDEEQDGSFCYLGPRRVTIENCYYYNNTVWNCDYRIRIWNRDSLGGISNVRFENNVFDSGMPDLQGGSPDLLSLLTLANNTSSSDASALFVDAANGDYKLRAGSPAIDAAGVIPGITDGYLGTAPDAGCYESGATPWTCGPTIDKPRYPDEDDAEYRVWLAANFTQAELSDPDVGSYSADPGGNGMDNIIDYALGLDPRDSVPPVLKCDVVSPTSIDLSYTRKIGNRSVVSINPSESTDLNSWLEITETPSVSAIDSEQEEVTYSISRDPADEFGFYRLDFDYR